MERIERVNEVEIGFLFLVMSHLRWNKLKKESELSSVGWREWQILIPVEGFTL